MIPGTWPAIFARLEAGAESVGVVLSDEILARVFNTLLQPLPMPKTPDPPGWDKSMEGISWEEASAAAKKAAQEPT